MHSFFELPPLFSFVCNDPRVFCSRLKKFVCSTVPFSTLCEVTVDIVEHRLTSLRTYSFTFCVDIFSLFRRQYHRVYFGVGFMQFPVRPLATVFRIVSPSK